MHSGENIKAPTRSSNSNSFSSPETDLTCFELMKLWSHTRYFLEQSIFFDKSLEIMASLGCTEPDWLPTSGIAVDVGPLPGRFWLS